MAETLTDTLLLEYEILESSVGEGKTLKARGRLGLADAATANGRVYPGRLMEREINRLKEKIENRACFGMLDHPKDGKTTLSEASHLVTEAEFDGKEVRGIFEVMGTPAGRTLQAILEAGGKVGVSSRGVGTTRKDSSGKDVVQDDYQLITWDFVADPAVATALPEFFREDIEGKPTEDDMDTEMTIEQFQERYPELYQQIAATAAKSTEESLKKDFEKKVIGAISDQQQQVEEKVRVELLSDPEVAGAKATLESVARLIRPFWLDEDAQSAVRNLEERNSDLEEELAKSQGETAEQRNVADKLMGVAEELGYKYYMERALGLLEDVAQKDAIIDMMGDVGRFDSSDEFKTAFEACVERVRNDEQKTQEENERIAALKAENAQLQEQLSKATQLGAALGVRAYAERKIASHPHAPKLREVLDESDFIKTEQVDALLESWDAQHPTSETFNNLRAKLAGGREHLNEDQAERMFGEEDEGGHNGLGSVAGVSFKELQELAGIVADDKTTDDIY